MMTRLNTDILWKTAVGGLGLYLLAKVFLSIGDWIGAPILLDIGGLLQAIAVVVGVVWAIAVVTLLVVRQL